MAIYLGAVYALGDWVCAKHDWKGASVPVETIVVAIVLWFGGFWG
jgi:hypothetical protein